MENYNRFEDPRHIEWAKQVKARDNFACRVCEAKQVYLNSHHLNSWDTFPECRFDVDNGVTLCQVCHNRFHEIYGAGRNTYLQFKEFLEVVKIVQEIVKEDHERRARRYRPGISVCPDG